jgi:lipopolysaccharide transport system ATP-binding protein
MTLSINLRDVSLDYHVYSVRAQSLRNAVFNLAVGGKMYKGAGDITVVRALSKISLNIAEGDRIALVGHNGSGKTSLLKVIAGVYHPTGGAIEINGSVTSMIALGAGLDVEATGLQNIIKLGLMRMVPRKKILERIDAIAAFSELGPFLSLPVRTYSAGMMARLMFSVATEFGGDILVLDEWLSAGDAEFMHKAADRMRRMVDSAKIVVLATHDFALVKEICTRVVELSNGEIVFYGAVADWLAYTDKREATKA